MDQKPLRSGRMNGFFEGRAAAMEDGATSASAELIAGFYLGPMKRSPLK